MLSLNAQASEWAERVKSVVFTVERDARITYVYSNQREMLSVHVQASEWAEKVKSVVFIVERDARITYVYSNQRERERCY